MAPGYISKSQVQARSLGFFVSRCVAKREKWASSRLPAFPWCHVAAEYALTDEEAARAGRSVSRTRSARSGGRLLGRDAQPADRPGDGRGRLSRFSDLLLSELGVLRNNFLNSLRCHLSGKCFVAK